MRLIDADAKECWACIHHATGKCDTFCDHGEAFELREDVKNAPTVEAVPVVRCKDCKYWICEEQTINGEKLVRCAVDDERWTGGNDFCSFGTKFVHGHWVEDPENETIVCSNCGQEFGLEYKIDVCMNCYAKMDGKDEPESAICGTTGLECIRCNPGPCDHRRKKENGKID